MNATPFLLISFLTLFTGCATTPPKVASPIDEPLPPSQELEILVVHRLRINHEKRNSLKNLGASISGGILAGVANSALGGGNKMLSPSHLDGPLNHAFKKRSKRGWPDECTVNLVEILNTRDTAHTPFSPSYTPLTAEELIELGELHKVDAILVIADEKSICTAYITSITSGSDDEEDQFNCFAKSDSEVQFLLYRAFDGHLLDDSVIFGYSGSTYTVDEEKDMYSEQAKVSKQAMAQISNQYLDYAYPIFSKLAIDRYPLEFGVDIPTLETAIGYSMIHKWEEADKIWYEALQSAKTDRAKSEILYNLATSALRQSNWNKAMELAVKSQSLVPKEQTQSLIELIQAQSTAAN